MVTGKIREVQMDNVKPFIGSPEDAYRAAMADNDHKGNPELGSCMFFKVFQLNTILNLNFLLALLARVVLENRPEKPFHFLSKRSNDIRSFVLYHQYRFYF